MKQTQFGPYQYRQFDQHPYSQFGAITDRQLGPYQYRLNHGIADRPLGPSQYRVNHEVIRGITDRQLGPYQYRVIYQKVVVNPFVVHTTLDVADDAASDKMEKFIISMSHESN